MNRSRPRYVVMDFEGFWLLSFLTLLSPTRGIIGVTTQTIIWGTWSRFNCPIIIRRWEATTSPRDREKTINNSNIVTFQETDEPVDNGQPRHCLWRWWSWWWWEEMTRTRPPIYLSHHHRRHPVLWLFVVSGVCEKKIKYHLEFMTG